MNYHKTVLAPLEKCYAVSAFPLGGRQRFLFASEVEAPCLCFDAESLSCETVWQGAGGTMAMVPLHGSATDFLAIQNFFPPFAAAASKLVWISRRQDGTYEVQDYLALPYLHRFGVVEGEEGAFLVLSTLCESKENKDDWSKPGGVYIAPLTASAEETPRPRRLLTGLFHNHGFFTGVVDGTAAVAVGSDQGVHLIQPPEKPGEDWRVRQLTDVPTGEVWLEDLDGDGALELITIEAFHGSALKVYHIDGAGTYRPVWQLPEALEFAHALWCGRLWGEVCGVCGSRRGEAPLLRFFYENGAYRTERIDTGASAANVWTAWRGGRQCLLSANHGQNECVLYTADSP